MKTMIKIISAITVTFVIVLGCTWAVAVQFIQPELERRNDILQEQVNVAERAVRTEEYKVCMEERQRYIDEGGIPFVLCSR